MRCGKSFRHIGQIQFRAILGTAAQPQRPVSGGLHLNRAHPFDLPQNTAPDGSPAEGFQTCVLKGGLSQFKAFADGEVAQTMQRHPDLGQ